MIDIIASVSTATAKTSIVRRTSFDNVATATPRKRWRAAVRSVVSLVMLICPQIVPGNAAQLLADWQPIRLDDLSDLSSADDARPSAGPPATLRAIDEISPVDPDDRFADYCRQQFAAALQGRRVRFQFNSSTLRTSAYPLLDALIEITSDCAGARIVITGHTDASGHPLHNQFLSEQRAAAVKTYMVAHGIAAYRLEAVGAGASQLLDTGTSRAARARNRRIEFALLMDEGQR